MNGSNVRKMRVVVALLGNVAIVAPLFEEVVGKRSPSPYPGRKIVVLSYSCEFSRAVLRRLRLRQCSHEREAGRKAPNRKASAPIARAQLFGGLAKGR